MEDSLNSSKSRILVIDDESFIRENLKYVLEDNGYEVSMAESGSEGWEMISTNPPDLVLLDLLMPDLNGHVVCSRVKASPELREVPIVMLTALNNTDDKVMGLDAGADDYIGKPFKQKELLARIKAQLRIKRLHDELKQSYMKLKELEDLKDCLIHMIVHDLKTPIFTIKGGVEIILDMTKEPGSVIEGKPRLLLKNAFRGACRMSDLVDDILDMSRLEGNRFPVKKTEVRLEKIIQTCLELLEDVGREKGIQFVRKLDSDLPVVLADERLIYRTFTNLISNSLKFTPTGGTITVSVSAQPDQETVVCSVEDTGMGIPKNSLHKIFNKFYQAGSNEVTRKGQGLGLSFCKMAVEAHGGQIWAESEENKKGSKFLFRIPLHDRPLEEENHD